MKSSSGETEGLSPDVFEQLPLRKLRYSSRVNTGHRVARCVSAAVFLVALLGSAHSTWAQTADNVLVVINRQSAASIQIGEYYSSARQVGTDHIVRIDATTDDSIERAQYELQIEAPIAQWLLRHGLQDRVLYIVLTKGVPLRVSGTGGLDGTVASVDSELTLLYRKMLGRRTPAAGRVANPYYMNAAAPESAKPFTRHVSDLYLVTRLDGFSTSEAIELIDRSGAAGKDGVIALDQKDSIVDRGGDDWLAQAAARLRATTAERVLLESSRDVLATSQPVIGYYSWGSNDPANQLRNPGLRFTPGAIGAMFVSSDGRTFAEPPSTWKPSPPKGGPAFGGSFQSLAGDLIRSGITAVAGHVAEPFLDATVRPQILFPAYLNGLNVAEAFYASMPYLSWQTVVVGDPLCAPFRSRVLAPAEIDGGIDAKTELPALFAQRRIAALAATGWKTDAIELLLKVDSRTQRGIATDAETETLLTRATEIEPRLAAAHLKLALMFETRQDFARAIDRYRKVVDLEPVNALALNNLAYAMAIRLEDPRAARPFAERAYQVSQAPYVTDTLAWILHLTGDDASARPLITRAASGAPENLDIRLHATEIHAALGDLVKAGTELAAALKIDPTIAGRADVQLLQQLIQNVPIR